MNSMVLTGGVGEKIHAFEKRFPRPADGLVLLAGSRAGKNGSADYDAF
jgi:hypothetical protein